MKPSLSIPAIVGLLAIAPTAIAWTAQDGTPATETAVAPAETTATDNKRMEQIPHTLKALEEAKAGKYGKLKRDDRRRLETAETDIDILMRKHPDLATLGDAERVRLFNAQETIIGIVSGLKRSQLVCTYRQNIGTRFRTKHCVTRDVAEAQRQAAKDAAHSIQNASCFEGEGGGALCGNP